MGRGVTCVVPDTSGGIPEGYHAPDNRDGISCLHSTYLRLC